MLLLLALALQEDPGKLVEALRSDAVEERLSAQRRLKALGPAAVPALTAASQGGDAETAARAALLLRLIAIRGTLTPRLCEAFSDAEERIDKGDGLRLFLDAAAVDGRGRPLQPTLGPEDLALLVPFAVRTKPESLEHVWRAAARRRVPAVAPLRGFLNRGDGIDALGDLYAVIALCPHAEPADLPVLLRRAWPWGYRSGETTHAAFEARDATLELAFRLRDRGLVEGVRPLLRDRGEGPRQAAAEVLALLGARDQAADIAALLQDRSASLKETACGALARMGAKEQADALRGALQDPFPNNQLHALVALHRLGLDDTRPRLLAIALGGGGYAHDMAMRALLDVGPSPAADFRANAAKPYALRGLGLVGDRADLPVLLGALTSTSPEVVRGAIRGLGYLRAKEAVEPLLAIDSPEALEALSAIGDPAALPALQRRPASPAVLRTRSRLGDPDVVAGASALLRSPDYAARIQALGILETSRSKEAVDLVRGALADADPYVRRQAADSLGTMEAVAAIPDLVAMLDKDVDYLKPTVAESLCRMGSAEGKPRMLEGWDRWTWPLNALRRPELWARLGRTPSKQDWSGTGREVLARFAAEAGLKLELAEAFRPEAVDYLNARPRRHMLVFADPPASATVREAIEAFLAWGPIDAILEDDRLRVLGRGEARAFWR